MSQVSGSTRVLKAFVAQANESYREAGLSQYQMRVKSDGTVDVPHKPKAGTPGAVRAGAGPTPIAIIPQLTQVASPAADTVQLSWKPVTGAVKYGIWQDGTLIGTVPNPTFTAKIAANSGSTLAIDAEFASGKRSMKTKTVAVARNGDAAVQAQVANDDAAAQAQAPAAQGTADAAAGAAATSAASAGAPAAADPSASGASGADPSAAAPAGQ